MEIMSNKLFDIIKYNIYILYIYKNILYFLFQNIISYLESLFFILNYIRFSTISIHGVHHE